MNSLEKIRRNIGAAVKVLRAERGMSQAQLAAHLDISQSQFSNRERGVASFTAEQLVALMSLFNEPLSRFTGQRQVDDEARLQSALARRGAGHLKEGPDVIPDDEDVQGIVAQALVRGTPRLVTALAPVLVSNLDSVSLAKLRLDLAQAGLQRRAAWLAANVLDAVRRELTTPMSRHHQLQYRRAELVLDRFLDSVTSEEATLSGLDFLDSSIRSQKTLDQISEASSEHSRRWSIVTAIQTDDFVRALRATRDGV
jgi:transcriptional regulator with XRE-family HTH domain